MSLEVKNTKPPRSGFVQLLLEYTFGALTEEQTQIIQKIDRHEWKIFDLITTVLDLSRLDAGQLPLAMAEVELLEFFKELQNEVLHLQEKSSLNFLWQLEENPRPLLTDPGKLKLILKNLIAILRTFFERHGVTEKATSCLNVSVQLHHKRFIAYDNCQ